MRTDELMNSISLASGRISKVKKSNQLNLKNIKSIAVSSRDGSVANTHGTANRSRDGSRSPYSYNYKKNLEINIDHNEQAEHKIIKKIRIKSDRINMDRG